MNNEENNRNLKLIVVLSKLTKALDKRLEPEIREMGITFTQFMVLEVLYNKGPQSVNQIIERTFSSSGNMGLVISNLIKSNLIVKKVSEADKRARVIDLTENGNKLISELFPKHVKSINDSFSGMSTNEKEDLIRLIKKLGKGL